MTPIFCADCFFCMRAGTEFLGNGEWVLRLFVCLVDVGWTDYL